MAILYAQLKSLFQTLHASIFFNVDVMLCAHVVSHVSDDFMWG